MVWVFDDSVRLLFAVDVFTVVFDFGLMAVLVTYGLGFACFICFDSGGGFG